MAEAYISLPTAGSGVSQMPVLSGSSSEPTSVEISMRERDSNGVQPHLSESFPHAWAGRSGVSPASQDSALERSNPNFEALKMLNRGASGFVQLARDRRTGQLFAIKYIPRGESFDVRTISRELMNQRMCSGHPNVIQLHEVFLTTDYLGIAMEYADGGDVSQFIDDQSANGMDGLPEEDARWLFQQLMVALDMIHRLGIVNRDVKLDNMMLHGSWPSPILKICDFGFSKDEAGQSTSKSTCGTPEYMAPEVLFEDFYDGKMADVWSIGVSLFVMLTGEFPFARPCDANVSNVIRMQRMFARIIKGDVMPVPHLSPACRDLLQGMLRPEPRERATLEQVAAHPWLAAAQPLLPPMRVNDQLVACMSKWTPGSTARGTCRQSAAQIQQLVMECAEAQRPSSHSRRKLTERRRGAMWPGVPEDELADEAAHHVVSPQRSLSAGHGAGGDFLAPAGAPSRFAGDSACSYTSAMRGSQEWAPAPASQGTKRQLSTVSADCLSGGVAPRTPQRHPGLPTGYGIAANGGSSPMRFGQSCDEGLQRLQQPARSFSTASASHMGDSGHLRGNGRPSAFPRASNDSWDSNDDTELLNRLLSGRPLQQRAKSVSPPPPAPPTPAVTSAAAAVAHSGAGRPPPPRLRPSPPPQAPQQQHMWGHQAPSPMWLAQQQQEQLWKAQQDRWLADVPAPLRAAHSACTPPEELYGAVGAVGPAAVDMDLQQPHRFVSMTM